MDECVDVSVSQTTLALLVDGSGSELVRRSARHHGVPQIGSF